MGHGARNFATTASSRCPGRASWASGGTRAVRSGRDLCSPRRRRRTGRRCSEDLGPASEDERLVEAAAATFLKRVAEPDDEEVISHEEG